jgi:predicted nucleic acid-binding protein
MKPTVYVETTVLSFYWDDRPDSAHRRAVTREWWRTEQKRYDVYTSYFVLAEVSNPVYPNWEKVRQLADQIRVLEVVDEIEGIVKAYMDNQLMPQGYAGDAAHLAMASYHEVDYLLTWNCRHLANANKNEHIRRINRKLGLLTPELVTPEQLFKEI